MQIIQEELVDEDVIEWIHDLDIHRAGWLRKFNGIRTIWRKNCPCTTPGID